MIPAHWSVPFIIRLVLLVVLLAASEDAAAQGPSSDFNGDGFSDIALGVPGENLGALADAGSVEVIYGSLAGLAPAGSQQWTQDSGILQEVAEANDRFGAAVGFGDFDGDGFADLAVGVPGEDLGAGVVQVLYGSAFGLAGTGNQLLRQGQGVPGTAQAGDRFGWSVQGADYDDDGFDDLAIGVIGETVKAGGVNVLNAGVVTVLFGSATGLTSAGAQVLSLQGTSVPGNPEPGDLLGWALTAGDFDGDGFQDLVVGVPFKDTAKKDTGWVHMFRGSAGGVTLAGNELYLQGNKGMPDLNCPDPTIKETCQEFRDNFGYAVSAGDYNNDGFDDITIGVPGERYSDLPTKNNAGQVHVVYGSASGPRTAGSQLWNQDKGAVLEEGESDDNFGASLASGDFDSDGIDDLAVGVPGEQLKPIGAPGVSEAGIVQVFYGAPTKITLAGQQLWSQDVAGQVEAFDRFATALSTGDFDGDGAADLAAGAPGEDLLGPSGSVADAGSVTVLYSIAGTGLAAAGSQEWQQGTSGIADENEAGDTFGAALTSH